MPSWRNKALIAAGAALLIAALPALSQDRNAPESLLPPGFGDPETLPPPAPETPAPPPPGAPAPPRATTLPPSETSLTQGEQLEPLERPRPLNYFTVPDDMVRPVDRIGMLEPGHFGLAPNAFGSEGVLLTSLMRRLDAPLPSRWTSIMLRRALLSRLAAPAGVHPVDWVAERADLLLRMGEADAARMLVQSVDSQIYTPRMIEVAAQTALATADPAGLCPLVEPAQSMSDDTVWSLAEAMCAALEGEPARATELADQARRREGATGIDLLLAEKVIGATAETRRAATIEWDGVDEINPWRFGLASATGVQIPAPLMDQAGPRFQAWLARAPMLPVEQRLGAASAAAALGVLSSQSLVEIYSLMLDQTDIAETAGTVGARLRTAWTDRDPAARMEALRSLWDEAETPRERYARLILTAGAAARMPVSADYADDADELVASMLSAGLDRQAARWASVVQEDGNDRAWAMLALGAPSAAVDPGRVQSFIEADDSANGRRSQMLVVGLAGLGRLDDDQAQRLAAAAGVDLGATDHWSAAIDRAARARQPGTVALLAGIGMQTGDWSGVPPRYLFRILRALRAVGLDYEARMIAAEAVARL